MQVIIIGSSATAVGTVESLREHDQTAEILVISAEPHGIYSRPLLSHALAGEIDRKRLSYRGTDFYCRHGVVASLANRVTGIDTEHRTVRTSSGDVHSYDKLVIAMGGQPIVPPMRGIDSGGVTTFATLDDLVGIEDRLATGQVEHAVVVGGGMIGIKATDALSKRGVQVTMVELAPRILSAALDETSSTMMTELFAEHGVEVLTEDTVAEIVADKGEIEAVTLRSGRTLPCELLVFGIGVRASSGLAKGAGIEVNRGIVVDEFMRTSAPDVYAAGDVSEAYDLVVDMNRTVAIWPNAYRQGAIAGAHIAGVERPDQGGIAMNAIEVCGVPCMTIGSGNVDDPDHTALVDLDQRSRKYRRLVFKDKQLVGAILVGNISRAGIYTGLIRHKVDVADRGEDLLSDSISLLSVPDTYRKHVVKGEGIEV